MKNIWRSIWLVVLSWIIVYSSIMVIANGANAQERIDLRKFNVKFVYVAPHNSHDEEGCGHWDMVASVNGKPIELMRSSCIPGGGLHAFDQADVVTNPVRNPFGSPFLVGLLQPPLGPKNIDITVPSNGFFTIETTGKERDQTEDDAPSQFTEMVNSYYPKLDEYLRQEYGKELSEAEKDIALYNRIFSGIATEFQNSDSIWERTLAGLGRTGETGLAIYALFGSSVIPLWGQIAAAGYAIFNLVDFLGNLNPDDGIGVINVRCDQSNNFCLGTHDYKSQFNGIDGDSAGDYDLRISVQELETDPIVSTRSSAHDGSLIQSRFGVKGNFDLLVPQADGNGFAQFYRENDVEGFPWRGPFRVDTIDGQPVGRVDAITMVQANNFGTPGLGDINAIVRTGDTLKLFWQEDKGDHVWHGPAPLPGTGFGPPE